MQLHKNIIYTFGRRYYSDTDFLRDRVSQLEWYIVKTITIVVPEQVNNFDDQ